MTERTELRSPRIDGKWERPRLPCHFLTCCLQFRVREYTRMSRDLSSYVPSMCSREAKMPEDVVSTLVFVQLRKGQGGMLIGHM